MLQARALQSRPNARHRYSLTPAQLQSMHPSPQGSPVTDSSKPFLNGQAVGQDRSSPSVTHLTTHSHNHSQHATSPVSARHTIQPLSGSPMVPKQNNQSLPEEAQDGHVAVSNRRCSAQPEMRLNPDQSLTRHHDPSDKADQTHRLSGGSEGHSAGHARSCMPPQAQPFRHSVSRLGPFSRPQSTVSMHNSPKV